MLSISPCWIYLKTTMCKQQISVFHKLVGGGFIWAIESLPQGGIFFDSCISIFQYAHTCRTVSGCFHRRSKCPGEENVPCIKVRVASHRYALSSWVSRYHPGYSAAQSQLELLPCRTSFLFIECVPFQFVLRMGYSALSNTCLRWRGSVLCVLKSWFTVCMCNEA